MSGFAVYRTYEERMGAGRQSHVEEIDGAITDLARVIGITAIETEMRDEYAPVVWHLVHARRALREAFGK